MPCTITTVRFDGSTVNGSGSQALCAEFQIFGPSGYVVRPLASSAANSFADVAPFSCSASSVAVSSPVELSNVASGLSSADFPFAYVMSMTGACALRMPASSLLEYANVSVTIGAFCEPPSLLPTADPNFNVIVPGATDHPLTRSGGTSVASDESVTFSLPRSAPGGNETESPFGRLSVPPCAPGTGCVTRFSNGG